MRKSPSDTPGTRYSNFLSLNQSLPLLLLLWGSLPLLTALKWRWHSYLMSQNTQFYRPEQRLQKKNNFWSCHSGHPRTSNSVHHCSRVYTSLQTKRMALLLYCTTRCLTLRLTTQRELQVVLSVASKCSYWESTLELYSEESYSNLQGQRESLFTSTVSLRSSI